MHVYLIQNVVNGKKYIGQHSGEDLDWYWRGNVRDALKGIKGKTLLYRAIRKYGADAFTVHSIYAPKDKSDMDNGEIAYIKFFGTQDPELGYNCTAGGEGSTGFAHSKETKEYLSLLKLGKKPAPFSEEHKNRIRLAKLGKKRKPFSEEWKAKIAKAGIGRTISEETREKKRASALAFLERKKHTELLGV